MRLTKYCFGKLNPTRGLPNALNLFLRISLLGESSYELISLSLPLTGGSICTSSGEPHSSLLPLPLCGRQRPHQPTQRRLASTRPPPPGDASAGREAGFVLGKLLSVSLRVHLPHSGHFHPPWEGGAEGTHVRYRRVRPRLR